MSGPTPWSQLSWPGDLAHQIRQREWERVCREQIERWERDCRTNPSKTVEAP